MEVGNGNFCRDRDCIINLYPIDMESESPEPLAPEPGTRIQVQVEFMVSSAEVIAPMNSPIIVRLAGPCLNIKSRVKKPVEEAVSASIEEIILDERQVQIQESEEAKETCHRFTGIGEDLED